MEPTMTEPMPSAAPAAPPPSAAGPAMPPPPMSEKGWKSSEIKALTKQTNATLEAMLGPAYDAMPPEQREVVVEIEGPRVEQFPPQLWAALSVIDGAVKQFAPDMAEKYDLELGGLADGGTTTTAAKLRLIEKDKKLLKALQSPDPAKMPNAPPPPKPEEVMEMDERAMGAM
jgi:hypothetical protein